MVDFKQKLAELKEAGQFREFKEIPENSLNLSANDYLGLATDKELQNEFYRQMNSDNADFYRCGSSSSRLLSGNHSGYELLETDLTNAYNREAAIVFNSGYHANIGILPALTTKRDLILCDKLNHASIIDGCRLCDAKVLRFRHNDMNHLTSLIEKNSSDYDNIFIIVESVFSMDGDWINLKELCEIKEKYRAFLIVDEAHGTGVFGEKGLGLCEELNLIDRIDMIVGTFGKALSSAGAYAICDAEVKNWLINTMRSLIFTTALPPVIVNWNRFVFNRVLNMKAERQHLKELGEFCRENLEGLYPTAGTSQIIPVITGDNHSALKLSEKVRENGYTVFAIRPPTVPVNSSRLRISLSAKMQKTDLEKLFEVIKEFKHEN